jgi:hypothetical protein
MEDIKKVPVVVGGLYLVEPMNPLKKKYRGEKVILIRDNQMDDPECLRVESEWHVKRKSYTAINICDLKFVTKDLPTDLAKLLE